MARFVRGRVSLTNLPDYADEARQQKLKAKENDLYAVVHNRIVGYPNNEYETKLRKNIDRYYKNEVDVDQAERRAVSKALSYLKPLSLEPEFDYNPKTHKRDIPSPPYLNSNGKQFKPFITKNGKRFRIR